MTGLKSVPLKERRDVKSPEKLKSRKFAFSERSSALSTEYVEETDSEVEILQAANSTKSSASGKSKQLATTQSSKPNPLDSTTKNKSQKPIVTAKATPPSPPSFGRVSSKSRNGASSDDVSEDQEQNDSGSRNSSRNSSRTGSWTGRTEGSEERGPATPAKDALRPQIQSASIQTILAYKPPQGFGAPSLTSSHHSTGSGLFSPSNLMGKQIWHITVPASISIDALQEVSMQSLRKGDAVLSYRCAEYGLVADPRNEQQQNRILVPDPQGDSYERTSAAITQTLHLQQLVRLPSTPNCSRGLGIGTEDTPEYPKVYNNHVHEQPKGLKMRYRPFGDTRGRMWKVGSEFSSPGSSDTEGASTLGSRVPAGIDSRQHIKKRSHTEIDGIISNHEESRAKKQRKKHPVEPKVGGRESSAIVEASPARSNERHKDRKYKHKDNGVTNCFVTKDVNGAEHKDDNEVGEDVAKRHEQRKHGDKRDKGGRERKGPHTSRHHKLKKRKPGSQGTIAVDGP